jgi:hypothetical protein
MAVTKRITARQLRAMIRDWIDRKPPSMPTIRRWLQLGVQRLESKEMVTLDSEICPTSRTRWILLTDAEAFLRKLYGEKKAAKVAHVQSG